MSVEWLEQRFFPGKPLDPAHPRASVLEDRDEIESLLPLAKRAGVGLGNTPYRQLETPEASIHISIDGCKRQKPGIRRLLTQIASMLFEPLLGPATVIWNPDRELDPKLSSFIERYGFRTTMISIDALGDRVTLPEVHSDRVVIVAGDSVANGILLADDETLASQLQAADLDRQYVNTGISGVAAPDVICAAEKAAENYAGKIDELIYVFCENDFKRQGPYGSPEEIVGWIEEFAREQNLTKVTVVYAPYIYNVIPQLTRVRGTPSYDYSHHSHRRRRLVDAVDAAGFRFVDFTDIALEENRRAGTMFAAFALYVDRVHHSRYGVARLAEVLRAPPEAKSAASALGAASR